jgi:hypothetical protein
LVQDTGVSASDGITSNPGVAGSGDPNATVTISERATALETTMANDAGAWTFTPSSLAYGSHTLVASETDAAGNIGSAPVSFMVGSSLFDFSYAYNGGKDYYLGTVADDGTFKYQSGQMIATDGGRYTIFDQRPGISAQAPGSVSVSYYLHDGVGAVPTIPMSLGNNPAGTAGLGSETYGLQGADGQVHTLSSTVEASFDVNTLYGSIHS